MANIESLVKDVIENEKDRIFDVLQDELNVNFPIPNIRICTELPPNARGNIDPKTLDLCVIVSEETILSAQKHEAEFGVKRDIRELVISELAYGCGHYAANLLTNFAYSDYSESIVEKLKKNLMEKDSKVRVKTFQTLYEERSTIEGRREGIAFFSQLKVLENYGIDKRFEEIIFPVIYEKILRSYVKEMLSIDSQKALYLIPDFLEYSAKVVRSYYKELLDGMGKPERRDFVLKKPGEITKEEIETAVGYLSSRGKVRIFFNQPNGIWG